MPWIETDQQWECGCRVQHDSNGGGAYLVMCPLHQAAPAMLEALKADEALHNHVAACDRCDTGDCDIGLELAIRARELRRAAIAAAEPQRDLEKPE